jgi:hypothetical protein
MNLSTLGRSDMNWGRVARNCMTSICPQSAEAVRTWSHSFLIFSSSGRNFSVSNNWSTNCRANTRPASESLGK